MFKVAKGIVSDLEGFIIEIGEQICQEKMVSSVTEVWIKCYESPEKGRNPVLECGVVSCVCVCVYLSVCVYV